MEQGRERAYGFGLSRDAHIAFAAAYVAILVTIAAVGGLRFYAQLPSLHPQTAAAPAGQMRPGPAVKFRAKPAPDPAFPHTIDFYPKVAILNHQEGDVVLRLLVLKTGQVGDVSIVKSSGYAQLDAAALVSAGNWRYLPAVRDGHPVNAEIGVRVRFKLAA